MANRKSAAKIKPIKEPAYQEPLPPIEEVFEDAKAMYLMTIETNIMTAKRIDNLLNLRDYAYKFWGEEMKNLFNGNMRVKYFKELQELSVHVYEQIKEIAEEWTLEFFSDETIEDPFQVILPKPENLEDENEMCRAGIIFLSIRPYADKMLKMHQLIQDEKAKREMQEKHYEEV